MEGLQCSDIEMKKIFKILIFSNIHLFFVELSTEKNRKITFPVIFIKRDYLNIYDEMLS